MLGRRRDEHRVTGRHRARLARRRELAGTRHDVVDLVAIVRRLAVLLARTQSVAADAERGPIDDRHPGPRAAELLADLVRREPLHGRRRTLLRDGGGRDAGRCRGEDRSENVRKRAEHAGDDTANTPTTVEPVIR